MTAIAGLAVASLLVVGIVACGEEGIEATDATTAPSTPVERLHHDLTGLVDYDFDLAVFVLDGGEVATAGEIDRLYAFDSITKTITGLVLASLIEDGTLRPDAAVGELLDAGRNGSITLVELASHTAGLSRLAPNSDDWPGFDRQNPYAGYTADMAEEALRRVERSDEHGYSNFGYQLLGLALERAAGSPLGELARDRVFVPAEMESASLPRKPGTLGPGLSDGRDVPAWDEQLGGAGAAVGSIDDLARYARAVLDPPPALAPVMSRALVPRAREASGEIGLGWITTAGLTWHNGGSGGYSAVLAIDLASNEAAGFLAASGDLRGEETVFDFLR